MLHVADQRVEHRVQLLVVAEVAGACAACLDDDCQGQWLRISFWVEYDMLRYAVIGDHEVVSGEFKHYLACFGRHQYRNHH